MDRDRSTSIFISNLPVGISENELKNELLRIFDGVAGMRNLKVTVFRPTGLLQKAVANGFDCTLVDLIQASARSKITIEGAEPRNFIWHNDKGDARDEFGQFVNPKTAGQLRFDKMLQGETYKKANIIFSDDFWNAVDTNVYDGIKKSTLTFNMANIDDAKLKEVASVLVVQTVRNYTSIKFATALDTLQAIRYMNQHDVFSNGCFVLVDERGIKKSLMQHCKGLGVNGRLLSIKDEADNGVLDLDKLDPSILNKELLEKNVNCIRCMLAYKIYGVSVNLNYLAGHCDCYYQSELDIMDKDRAFFWPGEKYTRLNIVSLTSSQLEVWHYPMKFEGRYKSIEEYRNIVLPLMFNEWKFNSRPFKLANSCDGIIEEVIHVETIQDDNKKFEVYGIKFKIPKTSFWKPENRLEISQMTLEFGVEASHGRMLSAKRKAKLLYIKNAETQMETSKHVMLTVQVVLPHLDKPAIHSSIHVIPKMDKYQYTTGKTVINRWAKGMWGKLASQEIFLDPTISRNWGKVKNIESKHPEARRKLFMTRFHSKLNVEQRSALLKSLENALSFIHGPPGTGKTFTAAAIIITLVEHEVGIILACGPSNICCDNLCRAIRGATGIFRPKILRIFSKRREAALLEGYMVDSQPAEFDCLHEMIRKSVNWLNTPELEQTDKDIRSGRRHLLTKEQITNYFSHVSKIELNVISNYDVIVCTLGALCDNRVSTWNFKGQISTVLVDEAGQATQPDTLPIFTLNAKRHIFIGDHLQLTPQIRSSSSRCGLQMSILEWVGKAVKAGNASIPWTVLLEQRRMEPSIRELVSKFTYNNELRDAEEISTRTYNYSRIHSALKDIEERTIVVYTHADREKKVGDSFKNTKQADYIIDLVCKLLSNGVPPNEITILSLYEAQRQEILTKFTKIAEMGWKKAEDLKKKLADVQVLNVDSFQGCENNIIILSVVRCNQEGTMGFTSNQSRLNVALSRAKFQLFIFLDLQTIRLNSKKTWTEFRTILKQTAIKKVL